MKTKRDTLLSAVAACISIGTFIFVWYIATNGTTLGQFISGPGEVLHSLVNGTMGKVGKHSIAVHDCTGEGCFVCTEIEACVCTICLLAEAVGAGAVVIFAYSAIQKLLSSYLAGRYLCPVSLVSLKIRLDD